MPFKPGQSGNPAGRPPGRDDARRVQLLARAQTDRAIAKLSALIDHRDGRIAALAASAILDRGWGKPAQYVEQQVTVTKRLTYAERVSDDTAPTITPESPAGPTLGDTVQ